MKTTSQNTSRIDITIVLPTYNGAKYLRESIDSCLAQTFRHWELIIVNDCSTDETGAIAEEYAARDNRIRVIHNEVNLNLPNSLNAGFRQAKGEYLTWTSDDNLFLPHALEQMAGFLREHPEHIMVCASCEKIDPEGQPSGWVYTPLKYHILTGNCIGACFLYHRNVLETVGEYDPNWFLVEDYEYWIRIAINYGIGAIGVIDQVLYWYRLHPQSLTCSRKADIGKMHTELLLKYRNAFDSTFSYKKRKSNIKSMISALGLKENIDGLKAFAARDCFDHPDDRRIFKFFLLKYKFKQNPLAKFVLECLTIFSKRKRKATVENKINGPDEPMMPKEQLSQVARLDIINIVGKKAA